MRKYRWGILAPGKIAHKFTSGLRVLPDAVPYAVGSRDSGRAQAFAQQYGFEKAYGSYRELAEDPNVDIVYVATPHPWHEEASLLCLENGKAVLCEKPFTVNARQTERMIECARKNGVFLMEAMWTRFLPAIQKVRELIAEGAIGKPRLVYADFGFSSNAGAESRIFSPNYAGGSLLDVGVYSLSFCGMVFGKQPSRVQSQMLFGETGVDVETALLLGYDEGESAHIHSAIHLATAHEAKIIGEKGRMELPVFWRCNTIRLHTAGGVEELALPYEATGYQFEASEVMRCLNEGLAESPVMPLEESLAIMRTMDRVRSDNGLRYPGE